jgi:hypothetical protein
VAEVVAGAGSSPGAPDKMHFLVRKSGHFVEYFTFALLAEVRSAYELSHAYAPSKCRWKPGIFNDSEDAIAFLPVTKAS